MKTANFSQHNSNSWSALLYHSFSAKQGDHFMIWVSSWENQILLVEQPLYNLPIMHVHSLISALAIFYYALWKE